MKSALYSSGSSQAKDLNCAVTYHIAKDAVLLSAVDKPRFRFMVSLILAISYPSAGTFLRMKSQECMLRLEIILSLHWLNRPHSILQPQICGPVAATMLISRFPFTLSAMGGSCTASAWRHCQCLQTTLVKI